MKSTHTMMKANDFLQQALGALTDRAASRDCAGGERSMVKTVNIFKAVTGLELTEQHGWMFMICLKLARDQQGAFHPDDLVDLAGYAGLYGECRGEKLEPDPRGYKHDFAPHKPTQEELEDLATSFNVGNTQ